MYIYVIERQSSPLWAKLSSRWNSVYLIDNFTFLWFETTVQGLTPGGNLAGAWFYLSRLPRLFLSLNWETEKHFCHSLCNVKRLQ